MTETENGTPKWVNELSQKYRTEVAHVFILHSNVADYVDHTNDLRSYLSKYLAGREIMAFYNRAEGITFPLDSVKRKFITTLGLNSQARDPALQALYSATRGESEETLLPRDPGSALPLLERMLKLETKTALIIDFAETLVPEGDMSFLSPQDRESLIFLQRWARDPVIMQNSLVILITRTLTDIHEALRAASSRIEAIEIPLPDFEARLSYIQFTHEEKENLDLDIEPKEFARLTAGLSKIHIEDVRLRAKEEKTLSPRELIQERKKEIIRNEFGDVIEILEPQFGFENIGGNTKLKNFFQKNLIKPIQEGNLRRVPMGVLLLGPPGCGKTIFMQAVARESGINCVILNLAKILGQYVSTSEKNLEKALRCIESLAPSIVIIDEIDQSFQRGEGGDTGVSNRLFKRLTEFMSDTSHRGRVFFAAASNRPDLIDSALKRPGRFDKKIPFLCPNEEERKEIFQTMFTRYQIPFSVLDFSNLARRTQGYTGAEIESIVLKSWEVAEDEGKKQVMPADINHALEAIRPSTSDIELMTLLALQNIDDKDLLPEAYKNKLDNKEEIEQAIQTKKRGRREL